MFIEYSDNRILNGDATAQAVIAWAAALGQNGTTDIIRVPTYDEHGVETTSELILSLVSHLMLESAPTKTSSPKTRT